MSLRLYHIVPPTGSIYHTVSPRLWHADLSFVSTANEPISAFDCQTAFELVPGSANELRNATCTPRPELFFDLYQQGDPLQVRRGGGGVEVVRCPPVMGSSSLLDDRCCGGMRSGSGARGVSPIKAQHFFQC